MCGVFRDRLKLQLHRGHSLYGLPADFQIVLLISIYGRIGFFPDIVVTVTEKLYTTLVSESNTCTFFFSARHFQTCMNYKKNSLLFINRKTCTCILCIC